MLSVEENELLLERLKSVLKAQEPSAVISEFLALIKNQAYQKALLYACKECKPQDAALFRMIAILIWQAPQIELDFNKKDEQSISAIQHSYNNQNSNLLKLLKGWGASTAEIDAGHEHDIYSRLTTPIKAKITASLTTDFIKVSNQLEALFLSQNLPDKNDINTDKENELPDSTRLLFINRTINFIHKYLKSDAPSSSIIKIQPSPAEAMELNNFKLSLLKLALFRIAKTAANLSGALRSYYSKCFQPVPFSWITLEQLSFFELLYDGTVNSVIEVSTKEWQLDEESRYIGDNFLKKGWDILYLSDRFIPLILNDLNILKDFFNKILLQIQMNERFLIEPIHLHNIKAMTSYIENNRSLAQLVQLTSFQTNTPRLKELREVKADAAASSSMSAQEAVKPKSKTLMEQHALLRTLQYIGDFTNGKKLSSAFYKLDPSIDWRALIVIRDAIAHQDERDYKYQIDALLNDPEMFEGIISEARDLHKRIAALIIKQEKRIGIYYGDAEEFCERVLRLENEKYESIPEAAPPIFQPRVTPEEQELFIQSLKAANIDEKNPNKLSQVDLDKLIVDCASLFTTGNEVSKSVFGAMLKPIAYLRKIGEKEKQLYGELKTILDKANTPQKLDSKVVREEQKEAASLREQEKDNMLVGLKLIRQLSKSLLVDNKEHSLTMLKRVDAALEATDNMCHFLFECGYFHKDQSALTTVEQWDAFNHKEGRLTLVNHLKSNDVLNNAMEYNFGQLLQHMDRIRTYKKSPTSPLVSTNYEQLRTLRNYVEHGSHFYDFARFVTSNNKAVEARYTIICKGLNYVVELREYLNELKDALTEESVVKKDSVEQKKSVSPVSRAGVLRLGIFQPAPCARHSVEFVEEEPESPSYVG